VTDPAVKLVAAAMLPASKLLVWLVVVENSPHAALEEAMSATKTARTKARRMGKRWDAEA